MKLTINQALLGAATFLVYLFGGYVALLLMIGFIFLTNQSDLCKRSSIKALITALSFSVLICLIGLIPDILSQISTLVNLFDGSFNYHKFTILISFVTGCIGVIRTIVFLMLAYSALKGKSFTVPFVDSLIGKNSID